MQAHPVQNQASNVEPYVSLPARSHTIFGVCEGLGEDFGINPIWFRVPLAAAVLWSPLMAIGAYFALGAVVLASRLLFPRPKALNSAAPVSIGSDNDREQLPIAA